MLDNRASGWAKTKKQNESGPKKLEELRQELEAKAREEEMLRLQAEAEEYSYSEYGGQRGYGDKRRDDRRDDRRGGDRGGNRNAQYQKKPSDVYNNPRKDDRSTRGSEKDYGSQKGGYGKPSQM